MVASVQTDKRLHDGFLGSLLDVPIRARGIC